MKPNKPNKIDAQLAKVIHDIRNPLNTISLNAELALMCLQNNLDLEKQEQLLNSIIAECKACSERLTDIYKQDCD